MHSHNKSCPSHFKTSWHGHTMEVLKGNVLHSVCTRNWCCSFIKQNALYGVQCGYKMTLNASSRMNTSRMIRPAARSMPLQSPLLPFKTLLILFWAARILLWDTSTSSSKSSSSLSCTCSSSLMVKARCCNMQQNCDTTQQLHDCDQQPPVHKSQNCKASVAS